MENPAPTPIDKKRTRKLATDPVRTAFVEESPVTEEPTAAAEPQAKAEPSIRIPIFGSNGREGQLDYVDAPALAEIVSHLIETCPEFSRLRDFRIKALWKRQGGNANGVPRMVDAKPANGLEVFAFGSDFLLWVAADHAAEAQLNPFDYTRYIFHALCHCGVNVDDRDESEKPTRRPHDLEMFYEEYARYGAWRPELQQMRDVVQQTTLDLGDAVTMKARI